MCEFASVPIPNLIFLFFSAYISTLVKLLCPFAIFPLTEIGHSLHFLPLEQPYCVSLFSPIASNLIEKISSLPCLLASAISLHSCGFSLDVKFCGECYIPRCCTQMSTGTSGEGHCISIFCSCANNSISIFCSCPSTALPVREL